MGRPRKKLSDEILRRAITQLLEESPPLPEINLKQFSRVQDDCDGDRTQEMVLHMLGNGDICIRIDGPESTLRFRNMIGGTASPHTHNALRLLMFAMWKDNELNK